jgi:hypothetical protein
MLFRRTMLGAIGNQDLIFHPILLVIGRVTSFCAAISAAAICGWWYRPFVAVWDFRYHRDATWIASSGQKLRQAKQP